MTQDPHSDKPAADEQYLKLLKGEITSEEYVEALRESVRGRSSSLREGNGSAAVRAERAAS